ncbi:uncharacterized protein LOC100302630 isoform X1 [Acyrthosiphon pisum]|uniref:Uncharacterized protein n=1 Tax=Acyrthosiphon pisum TaxID=7029 RepID=A0A8R2NPD0_ACYPI|nr:uncharacterized protein LOC100302630 isoform X1 [Acyrthosiphon pisum]
MVKSIYIMLAIFFMLNVMSFVYAGDLEMERAGFVTQKDGWYKNFPQWETKLQNYLASGNYENLGEYVKSYILRNRKYETKTDPINFCSYELA